MNEATSEPALARPAAFSDEAFADARARAIAEGRWLVVDVVDASNPICWAAAYTTWRDPDLVAWLEKYAIAVQVDARADLETADALGVDAAVAPLVILFRDGRERLRISGRHSPEELLRKLVRIDVADDNLALARKMLKHPERDMQDRKGLADALLRAGMLEEALGHYDWLWQHMAEIEPQMDGVRMSFMADEITELCDKLPAARACFTAHRDAAAAAASTRDRAGLEACLDHIILNEVLDDEEPTLAWLDRLGAAQRRELPYAFGLHLLPLLYERKRWAEAGDLIREPLDDLETIIDRATTLRSVTPADEGAYARHLIEEGRPTEAKQLKRHFPGLHASVAALHRSLVAAGRDADAGAVAEAALRFEDSPAMRAALR
jgi:hypothetical protein